MNPVTRTTVKNAETFIAQLKPFKTRSGPGGLWASNDPVVAYLGELPEEFRTQLVDAAIGLDGPGVAYVVYSFRTPIAWVTHDGSVHIPSVKYSVTTTRYQFIAQNALRS